MPSRDRCIVQQEKTERLFHPTAESPPWKFMTIYDAPASSLCGLCVFTAFR